MCFPAARAARNNRYVCTRSLGRNGDVWLWNSTRKAHRKKVHCYHCVHIESANNVPLVTRRKCSSTTEYLLSCKEDASGRRHRARRNIRFVDRARNQIRWRTNRLTRTTYSVPSSSSRSSPTYRFGLYGGSNTSLRFSFSFSLSRRSRSKCGVGMSGFCSSAGHSLISNYTKKRVFYWFRAGLGLAMGGKVRLTHIDGQVPVRVSLRGEEEQIARLFSLVEGRPDG